MNAHPVALVSVLPRTHSAPLPHPGGVMVLREHALFLTGDVCTQRHNDPPYGIHRPPGIELLLKVHTPYLDHHTK